MVISEASDHSKIAAFSCVSNVFQFVRHNLPLKVTLHIWSDGYAAQFRSRYVFTLLTTMSRSVILNTHYNERHHGKGPMNGVGGTLKNIIFRDVMSEKCFIQNAEEFSNYANTVVNGITSVYLPQNNVLTEPDDIEEAPKIPETLSIHKVVRGFNEDGICYFKFYYLSKDSGPFFTQYYRKKDYPEVCGHELLPLSFDADETSAFCKGKYEGKLEWLQCSICEQ